MKTKIEAKKWLSNWKTSPVCWDKPVSSNVFLIKYAWFYFFQRYASKILIIKFKPTTIAPETPERELEFEQLFNVLKAVSPAFMNMAPRLINKFLSATAAERFHFRSFVSSVRDSLHERLLMGYGKLAHLINLVRIIDTYYCAFSETHISSK